MVQNPRNVPEPVVFGGLTFVFKGTRACVNSRSEFTKHCAIGNYRSKGWWFRRDNTAYSHDLDSTTIQVQVCVCGTCRHKPLSAAAVMSSEDVTHLLEAHTARLAERDRKRQTHSSARAAILFCAGVDTEGLEATTLLEFMDAVDRAVKEIDRLIDGDAEANWISGVERIQASFQEALGKLKPTDVGPVAQR